MVDLQTTRTGVAAPKGAGKVLCSLNGTQTHMTASRQRHLHLTGHNSFQRQHGLKL